MQKYIAVVNHRMDDDQISHLIAKDIAGAIFNISHQNYPLAAKLIKQIKDISTRHNRPVSIIQDVSGMIDPLDLEFGLQSGVDWLASDRHEHLKMAKGLSKLAGLIYKGRDLPKGFRVDAILSDGFLDPDAQILGMKQGMIKHMMFDHPNQKTLDSLLHISSFADTSALAVSDLELAKALSMRRPNKKIIFATKNLNHANKAAIYWGVHPVHMRNNLVSSMKSRGLAKKGDRVVDATNAKHVAIHLIP